MTTAEKQAFMAMLEVLQAVERRLTIELHDCKHTNFPLSAAIPQIRAAIALAEEVHRATPHYSRPAQGVRTEQVNASLIAAAPDLLAALESAPEPMARPSHDDCTGPDCTYARWYDGPRAAALAKGKL